MPTVTGRSPGRVQHLESSSYYYSLFVLFLFFFTSLYLYFLLQTPFFPFPPVRPPLPLTFYLLAQLSDISAPPRIFVCFITLFCNETREKTRIFRDDATISKENRECDRRTLRSFHLLLFLLLLVGRRRRRRRSLVAGN